MRGSYLARALMRDRVSRRMRADLLAGNVGGGKSRAVVGVAVRGAVVGASAGRRSASS